MKSKNTFANLSVSYGQVIFKAALMDMGAEDPEFGMETKKTFNLADPVLGKIKNINETEDGKYLELKIVHVNTHGEPLPPQEHSKGYDIVKVPLDEEKGVEFGENVWTDDEDRVKALCSKLNAQCVAALKHSVKKFQEKLDLVEAVLKTQK